MIILEDRIKSWIAKFNLRGRKKMTVGVAEEERREKALGVLDFCPLP